MEDQDKVEFEKAITKMIRRVYKVHPIKPIRPLMAKGQTITLERVHTTEPQIIKCKWCGSEDMDCTPMSGQIGLGESSGLIHRCPE